MPDSRPSQPPSADMPPVNPYLGAMRFLRRLTFLQGFIAIFLLGVLIYNIEYGIPQDRYFAMASKGAPRRLVGLQNPYLNRAAVETWAATAVTSIMTFGFNDLQERFAENRIFFTPGGWRSFNDAMDRSQLKSIVASNQQIITAIVTGTPAIVYVGPRRGEFTWIVQAPMAMTIRAGGKVVNRRLMVRLTLIRMPTTENPMGIGIDNWASS